MAGGDVDVVAGAAAKGEGKKAHVRHQWTSAMKAEFLDHLAATCNVSASARAIGVPRSTAHGLRRRDATFASGWAAANEAGYQLLETHLIGIALAKIGAVVAVDNGVDAASSGGPSGEGGESGPGAASVAPGLGAPPSAEDFDAAFSMLRHRAMERARGPRGGRPLANSSTRKDTDAEILKKLAALAARRSSS